MTGSRPALTRRGWGVVVGSAALVMAARVLGIFELFVLAAGGMSLAVGAAAMVAFRQPRLGARRLLSATRAHAGETTRVELRMTNEGRRRSPPVWLHDRISGGRRASLPLPALSAGAGEQAYYQLPALDRGLHPVGPLEAQVVDPFGLVERFTSVAPPTELLVYPRIHAVRPLASGAGEDVRAGSPSAKLGPTGDDFSSLRPYQVGDDLRRVHWPSTARRDELMVRQHEPPRQGRVTVLLDTRETAHSPGTFEPAVSAAASILVACRHHGLVVRLVTTAGDDSGFGTSAAHVDACLARLAVVQPRRGSAVHHLVAHHAGPSAVVVVTADEAVPASLGASPARRRAPATVVLFDQGFAGPAQAAAVPGVIPVPTPGMFVTAWDRAMTGSPVPA